LAGIANAGEKNREPVKQLTMKSLARHNRNQKDLAISRINGLLPLNSGNQDYLKGAQRASASLGIERNSRSSVREPPDA
jgi:hypothetical protein